MDLSRIEFNNIDTINTIALIAVAIVVFLFVILLIKFLTKPIHFIFKLLLNMVFGFILLFIFNIFGSVFGVELKLTYLNALISGVLGVPGVVILLLVRWLF